MKISDLARATDTPTETIRYYEREGLLPAPARGDNNYRRYSAAHLQRLQVIRRSRALGLSLDEVRALLAVMDEPEASCDRVSALIDAHLGHVAERLRELEALQQQLQALQAACHHSGPAQACGILQELWAGTSLATAAVRVHGPQEEGRQG
ncbi:MerR family transcriptional regulator [Ideonella paludis]|uniref:MerR family transcriptional regulator n=1 Tax=Ideonella paludis TaxID=1233411 RepID=A0ABS5E1Q7_9BURK|nr:MerR family transcriptional regulator [Ideonella paludis]MBQ0937361.1 MerR family transcriptional regulator [Ideonella paludis]